MWDGGQARPLAWFLARLRAAEESHEYNLLVKSATALIPSSGTIAVFSPKHAFEHASNTNVGTFAKPNARERENLSALIAPTAASAATTSSTSMHGGLPDSELRLRRTRPDVPMGTAIDTVAERESSGRKLEFDAEPAGTSMATVVLLVLVFIVQMLMLATGLMCNGYYVPCRSFLPMPVCEAFGYADSIIILAPPTIATAPTMSPDMPSGTNPLDTPTVTGFVRDPGLPARTEVGGGTSYGGVGGTGTLSHILMPALVCLLLALQSTWATVNYLAAIASRHHPRFFGVQAKPRVKGLGHPNDPPQDTSKRTPTRRARVAQSAPARTASRSWRTLGEAPLWISLVLLVHEIATYIVPNLAALSIATLAVPVLRAAHAGTCHVCSHPLAAPARVTVRIVINTIVVFLYLSANLAVNTFVSEGAVWPPPLQRDAPSPSCTRLRHAAHAVSTTLRALLHGSWADLSRWGGVVIDCVFFRQEPSSQSIGDHFAAASAKVKSALSSLWATPPPYQKAQFQRSRCGTR
jgi:hypothetical protein